MTSGREKPKKKKKYGYHYPFQMKTTEVQTGCINVQNGISMKDLGRFRSQGSWVHQKHVRVEGFLGCLSSNNLYIITKESTFQRLSLKSPFYVNNIPLHVNKG